MKKRLLFLGIVGIFLIINMQSVIAQACDTTNNCANDADCEGSPNFCQVNFQIVKRCRETFYACVFPPPFPLYTTSGMYMPETACTTDSDCPANFSSINPPCLGIDAWIYQCSDFTVDVGDCVCCTGSAASSCSTRDATPTPPETDWALCGSYSVSAPYENCGSLLFCNDEDNAAECSDGINNDCDTDGVDCADSGCSSQPFYNACDGMNTVGCGRTLPDSRNVACDTNSGTPNCNAAGGETACTTGGCCNDGYDNDCDGSTDAADSDCTACSEAGLMPGDSCSGNLNPDLTCLSSTYCIDVGNDNVPCSCTIDNDCCIDGGTRSNNVCLSNRCYRNCIYDCTVTLDTDTEINQEGASNWYECSTTSQTCVSCQTGAAWNPTINSCGWTNCDGASDVADFCTGAAGDRPNDNTDGYYCDTANGYICCPTGSSWDGIGCAPTGGCDDTNPCPWDFSTQASSWWTDPNCYDWGASSENCCPDGIQLGEPWYTNTLPTTY